ncbi:GNAT family N-acetyltransferase [Botrimarina mediterranea]|uniref:GNAT family N-acetyltransferase n=1 Tax=Botrimarina mediterranea TaxID=2528022 RepID=UPI00118CC1C7|nr:Mycothiol acetyltransferase [Planctomycetes bacterium K2D]
MSTSSLRIRVAAEPERRQALELVLRPLAPESRGPLLDAVAGAEPHALGPLDALLVAVDGERVVAATWAQPSPGKAASLWPPEWVGKRPQDAQLAEAALIAKAAQACDAAGVAMTQTLFERSDDARIAALAEAGYDKIATLQYMGRSIRGADRKAAGDDALSFEPYSPREHGRLKRLLTATYIDSLDCPGLEVYRDLDDVLAGYRATGIYDPRHWLVASRDGEDVGVVLVAEHPGTDQAELIYMGLTPAARGRGYGKRLVQQAISAAASIGVDQLMVAVDEGNAPAKRLYQRAGFAAWAKRYVYVRPRSGAK